MTTTPTRRPLALPLSMIFLGLLGFVASFALTLDKIALLKDKNTTLACSVSIFTGCGTNLNSPQGEVFGFPNSMLGIVFYSATITVGVAILAGATFARWFWVIYAISTAASLALVLWFISESLFVIGVLCTWCMLTWAITIPLFLVVVLHSMRSRAIPGSPRLQGFANAAFKWIPLITLVSYLIIAGLAQWRLDIIGQLMR